MTSRKESALRWPDLHQQAILEVQTKLSYTCVNHTDAQYYSPILSEKLIWEIALERNWDKLCGSVICANRKTNLHPSKAIDPQRFWFCGDTCLSWMRKYAEECSSQRFDPHRVFLLLNAIFPAHSLDDLERAYNKYVCTATSPRSPKTKADISGTATPSRSNKVLAERTNSERIVVSSRKTGGSLWSSEANKTPITQNVFKGHRRDERNVHLIDELQNATGATLLTEGIHSDILLGEEQSGDIDSDDDDNVGLVRESLYSGVPMLHSLLLSWITPQTQDVLRSECESEYRHPIGTMNSYQKLVDERVIDSLHSYGFDIPPRTRQSIRQVVETFKIHPTYLRELGEIDDSGEFLSTNSNEDLWLGLGLVLLWRLTNSLNGNIREKIQYVWETHLKFKSEEILFLVKNFEGQRQ